MTDTLFRPIPDILFGWMQHMAKVREEVPFLSDIVLIVSFLCYKSMRPISFGLILNLFILKQLLVL